MANTRHGRWGEPSTFAATVTRLYSLLQREGAEVADLRRRLERAEPGIIDEFKHVHDTWDESYHERTDAPHAGPVTQRVNDFVNLTGTADDICERISQLGGLGVTTIEAATYSIIDQKGMMREIGNQIMPHFRV